MSASSQNPTPDNPTSAREDLFRRVAGAFIAEDRANDLLNAFRAEVLNEAADALADRVPPVAAGPFTEHDRKLLFAASELRRMASEGGMS
ncbi:hypothetical protein [Streptomyces sp. NPDC050428]|uniref:hypothetical protein n=1 Tax=Streptomyces sp. NPDC050428 TaxID=3155757 RepID=UPI0034392957